MPTTIMKEIIVLVPVGVIRGYLFAAYDIFIIIKYQ
jgi:hypothetical protein